MQYAFCGLHLNSPVIVQKHTVITGWSWPGIHTPSDIVANHVSELLRVDLGRDLRMHTYWSMLAN